MNMLEHNGRPVSVLTIAATDSSNGAGVTADLATMNFFGVMGVAAITAVTAQNFDEVLKVKAVKNKLFVRELAAVSARSMPEIKVIKLGLIPSEKILRTVVTFIRGMKEKNPDLKVVWDPVAVSGTGSKMSEINYNLWIDAIMPLVDVFTPNLNEAMVLSGIKNLDVSSFESVVRDFTALAAYFKKKGCAAVYLKGGHLPHYISEKLAKDKSACAGIKDHPLVSSILDVVISGSNDDVYYFGCPRTGKYLRSSGVHGTGCIMASAIAAMLARDYDSVDAIAYAKAYMTRGIENSIDIGAKSRMFSHGYFTSSELLKYFPVMGRTMDELRMMTGLEENSGFVQCAHNLGLYPVVDSSNWIRKLCENGVKTMQLRIKNPESQELLEKEISVSAELCRKYGVRLFIDDYYDMAVKYHAYGVHLGQEDLLEAKLKQVRDAGLRLGVSTHGYAEIARALLLKPSYIALGHIYPTGSKVMASKPQGPERLKDYVELVDKLYPTVAIGGIKLHNLDEVMASGTGSVAVITAITGAEDPEQAIAEWLDRVGLGDAETIEKNPAGKKAAPEAKTAKRASTRKKTAKAG